MISNLRPLADVERLRIPLESALAARHWKEWYHFVFFDRASGHRVLANISLSGSPDRGEIQTTLVATLVDEHDRPQEFGTSFSVQWRRGMVQRFPVHISARGVELRIDGRDSGLELSDARARLRLRVRGEAKASPLLVTDSAPVWRGTQWRRRQQVNA